MNLNSRTKPVQKIDVHPELKDASLEKVCDMANQLVNSFDGRWFRAALLQ